MSVCYLFISFILKQTYKELFLIASGFDFIFNVFVFIVDMKKSSKVGKI